MPINEPRATGLKAGCAAVILSFLLGGCAAPDKASGDMAYERELRETVAEGKADKQSQPVPEAVSQALITGAGAARSAPAAERFDVAVNEMPARTFFLSLIADAGVNVVAHPDIEGAISLELNDVTIREVLDVTREVYGYEYKYQNSIYTIYPRKLRTQVFSIDYIDVQRVGVTDTSVLTGKIESDDSSNRGYGGGGGSDGGEDNANLLGMLGGDEKGGTSGNGMQPGSRVQTLNRTDFWRTLRETIAAIVGDSEGRMVMVNPQAGMVVVKGLPRELSAVRDFLDAAELSVKRQVILETKILEVRLNDGYRAGINWGSIQGQLLLTDNVTSFESPVDITGFTNAANQVFSSVFKVGSISDLLSLLETQGSVQVLSSPRVSTVNNQKAVIRVGSDEFFVTGISSNVTSGLGTATTTPNIELNSFFSGISLDVTPQISEDGSVILHVHPVVSQVQDQVKNITVGDEDFSLPLALRDIRESDSIVRARSGEVVVLGGLMQETNRSEDGQQPGLGDVPVLGKLFNRTSREKSKTELVILMRPIVVDEDTWQQQLSENVERAQHLRNEWRGR